MKFKGFKRPNYTQVPDQLFDELMSELSDAELRVLLYIVRRTFGFEKEADSISYNQFLKGIRKKDGTVLDRGCGIKGPQHIRAALQSLEEKEIIVAHRTTAPKGNKTTTVYALRFEEGVLTQGKYPTNVEEVPVLTQGKLQETDIQETVQQDIYSNTDTSQNKCSKNGQASINGYKGVESVRGILHRSSAKKGRKTNSAADTDPSKYDPDYAAIKVYLQDVSLEFRDRSESNHTAQQFYNLYKKAGCSLQTFIDRLYQARDITKEAANVESKMGYFYTVLEQLLS